MGAYEVPQHLVDAILDGRCIAFVGAGFAMPVVPTWAELLEAIAEDLGHPIDLGPGASAFEYEAIGQQLQDRAGSQAAWEALVQRVLLTCERGKDRSSLDDRCRWLRSIPFKAILTTNFDGSLAGSPTDPSTYWQVLRGDRGRGWQLPDDMNAPWRTPPVIKLHGDANGDVTHGPLVFGRADYRRLVHGESRYANFVRAAFAHYTVLFIGVSFTDAYLNELRSEVLSILHTHDREGDPWGYAIQVPRSRDIVEFFRKHESIHVLEAADFTGVDRWLEAIAKKTSVRGRLKSLLEGKSVVWVDKAPKNNTRGVELLQECGVRVTQLLAPEDLRQDPHASADLILSHYGFELLAEARAYRVLERVRTWDTRPPVIVFASRLTPADALRQNRLECLRRGAWEYTTVWSELYRYIELLFDRTPGEA